jgi:hypothetical protein
MLSLESHPEVFVVGDMAYLEGYRDEQPYPMVAQVAMQQGRRAAKNIAMLHTSAAPKPFRYNDKGQMAIVGRRSALVDGFGLRLCGRLAWIAWLGLHLLNLRGVKNRLSVMLDWVAVYTRRTRTAGVITRPEGVASCRPAPYVITSGFAAKEMSLETNKPCVETAAGKYARLLSRTRSGLDAYGRKSTPRS